jgi:hypothetical protein
MWPNRRVRYDINNLLFTPHDIEHGILRGNRCPPYVPFRPFGVRDARRAFVIDPPDPRAHFALVCTSSSCPPIEYYTAENIDRELSVAASTFINGSSVRLDRRNGRVLMSRIFK